MTLHKSTSYSLLAAGETNRKLVLGLLAGLGFYFAFFSLFFELLNIIKLNWLIHTVCTQDALTYINELVRIELNPLIMMNQENPQPHLL